MEVNAKLAYVVLPKWQLYDMTNIKLGAYGRHLSA